jgi:hypothetical protein
MITAGALALAPSARAQKVVYLGDVQPPQAQGMYFGSRKAARRALARFRSF